MLIITNNIVLLMIFEITYKNISIFTIFLLILFLPIIVEGTVKPLSNTLNQSSISIDDNQTLSTFDFNNTELSSISALENLRYQIAKILLNIMVYI